MKVKLRKNIIRDFERFSKIIEQMETISVGKAYGA
jgi:hypothetical protein